MNKARWSKKIHNIFLFPTALALLLTGCSGPLTATPPPTQAPVKVAITPELRPLTQALSACTRAHPDIALLLDETPGASLQLARADFALSLGLPVESQPITSTQAVTAGLPFFAPLAQEEIVVIVNQKNPVSHLSGQELEDLFSGQVDRWAQPDSPGEAVQVWVYPDSSPLRAQFDNIVMNGSPTSGQAMIAPSPSAMLEAVKRDPGAIGYVPHAWLDSGVRSPSLDPALASLLRMPVLALAPSEPQGPARVLLGCLQQGEGQQLIKEKYQ